MDSSALSPSLPASVADRGVLLVGHGTRERKGTEEFFELADRLSARCPCPVVASLLEFQEPTIAQGWQQLVSQGAKHVHVAPLLLFAAGHAKSDIPDEVAVAASQTPGVTHDQCRPLSRATALVDRVEQLVSATLSSCESTPERIAVLMVGRGSRDPCARSDMFVLSELIRHRFSRPDRLSKPLRPLGMVSTAFYAMTTPTVPKTLDDLASGGRFDTIVVHPHLLFQGRLFEAIDRQCREASSRHPQVKIVLSPYLGPVDAIADSILHRIGIASPSIVAAK